MGGVITGSTRDNVHCIIVQGLGQIFCLANVLTWREFVILCIVRFIMNEWNRLACLVTRVADCVCRIEGSSKNKTHIYLSPIAPYDLLLEIIKQKEKRRNYPEISS